jgi:hypothetical protein
LQVKDKDDKKISMRRVEEIPPSKYWEIKKNLPEG